VASAVGAGCLPLAIFFASRLALLLIVAAIGLARRIRLAIFYADFS